VAIDGINSKCLDFYILKTDYDTMLFSSIDHLLYAKENGIFVAHARTEEEREKALITQNTVFSEEHLELPYEKGIKIIGTSEYADFTDIFVAVLKRNIIGTTSISRRNESLADRFGTYFGLPLEEFYDISSLTGLDENLIQVRNAAVLPEYQNRRIAPMIWGEIYRVATMQEPVSKYAAILAGSEIRDAKKAKALYEKIKGTPMFDAEKTVMLKKENELTYEGRLTEEDINDALLTKNLKLYAKMNFKFVGEPVYYPNFRMFDFPMLLKTDEIAEPYKTWFMKRKI
jgi:ribosomal protein S18 acetylase RimI-like enzyme